MTLNVGDEFAVVLVAKIAALGVLVSSLEYLARQRELGNGGLMSWSVGSLRNRWLAGGVIGRSLHVVLRYPNVLGLLAARAVMAAAVLLAPPQVSTAPALVIPLAVVTLVFLLRSHYGLDGSDQMLWLIFAGLALVSLADTPAVRTAYLWFVALQCCLSYFVAGVAKASAQGWRAGSYLVGIFQTRIYGHAGLSALLQDHRQLATILARLVITWECVFPAVLAAPVPIVLIFIAGGAAFHVVNAYIMGLNIFVWAFLAAYPAILFCASAW